MQIQKNLTFSLDEIKIVCMEDNEKCVTLYCYWGGSSG